MMRFMLQRSGAALAALALITLLLAGATASAQGWGTVKGQVVYDGDKLPDNPEVKIDKDVQFCTSKGKIHRNEWVVDKKSKGVKWVLVWLTDVKNATNKSTAWTAPIHPKLKEVPKTFEIDQPICTFIPRLVAMREGSLLVVKNSATIPHNTFFKGGALGPDTNQLIPAGKQLEVKEVKARPIPCEFACTIHTWMKGWLGVFKHPYYAVTNEKGEFEIKDAPAGKFRLMVWHEGAGFLQKDKDNRGMVITIKDKEATDVKAIKIKE
jgi:hypothetical protein